ncbi:MAG: c-type cytochrome [Planctomycetota bacterium]
MRALSLSLLSAALLFVFLSGGAVAASKKRRPVKVRVKRPRKKTPAGGVAMLKVKVKNRTREAREVTLELSLASGTGEVFARETFDLGPEERRKLIVPCPVPADHAKRKLRVIARIGEAEDDTKVRVDPVPVTEWERGRELFLASCAGCHGTDGADIRGEGLEDWLEAVREGEDDMPPIPGLSRDDVLAMRMYMKDPDRFGDPEPAPADADWLRGREVFLASCAGCHGEDGADIRHEDLEDWLEAVREGEDDMPAIPGLTSEDVRLARNYVQDPDRFEVPPDEPPPDPAPSDVTYEGAVKQVLDQSCVVCHNAGNALGGIRADTYAEAFANRTAIVDSVEKSRMPPAGPLSQSLVDLLRSWLDAGAPEK